MWVRFDYNEPPAPALPVRDAQGAPRSLADYRGRANVVLFFAHAAGCDACRAIARELEGARAALQRLDAELVAVWPERADAPGWLDAGGELRRRYAALLEWDTRGQVLAFVLDQYGAPAGAWVGEHDQAVGLAQGAQAQLERLALRCPE